MQYHFKECAFRLGSGGVHGDGSLRLGGDGTPRFALNLLAEQQVHIASSQATQQTVAFFQGVATDTYGQAI